MKSLFIYAVTLICACIIPHQILAADAPQYYQYASRIYTGPVSPPDLNSHPEARTYRTRLRNAARGQVNFAGEYILATWGCGTSCLMGAAINARTGQVFFLPFTVCCSNDFDTPPIDTRDNSNLIVFNGLLNEEDPDGRHYYVFRSGRFEFIESKPIANTPQTVSPTCPDGYILSNQQCVLNNAAPTPTCPNGYTFSGGGCVSNNTNNSPSNGNRQQCLAQCDQVGSQCDRELTQLGDANSWDGDLRRDYWDDTCVPRVNSCKFHCNPKGSIGPGECRFTADGGQICS